jgi:DNA-binding transcriptional LysR family regulator
MQATAFLKPARDIVHRADSLETMFRRTRKETNAILRVGAIDSAAAGLMPRLLSYLREDNPDIDIELLEQKTIRLLPQLLSGRLDIAIVRPPAHWIQGLQTGTFFSKRLSSPFRTPMHWRTELRFPFTISASSRSSFRTGNRGHIATI